MARLNGLRRLTKNKSWKIQYYCQFRCYKFQRRLCRSVKGNSISDHLVYYGVELMAKTWRPCKIVMGPGLLEHGRTDLEGNFVLSRDLATPVLKLKAQSDSGGKPL